MKNFIIIYLSIGIYMLYTFAMLLSCSFQLLNKAEYILFIYLPKLNT